MPVPNNLYFFIEVSASGAATPSELDPQVNNPHERAFVILDDEAINKLSLVNPAIKRIMAAVGHAHAMEVRTNGAAYRITFRESDQLDAFQREELEALVSKIVDDVQEGHLKLRANAASLDPQAPRSIVPNGKTIDVLRSGLAKSDGSRLVIGAVHGAHKTVFPQVEPTDFTERGSTELLRKHGPHPVIGFCCGMKGNPDVWILASGDKVAIPIGFTYSLLDIVMSIRDKPHLHGDITRLSGDSIWDVTPQAKLIIQPLLEGMES